MGSVEDHTTIAWQRATIEGAEGVEAYGLDASPALSVIIGAMGAVGPKPDLVLSGINHGVNVGRSILHSGTVGAALTASQLGMSALAVSLRAGETPDPWESAADLAVALIPLLVSAPVRTVLNLNVPALPMDEDPRAALGPGQRAGPHQGGQRHQHLAGTEPTRDGGPGSGRRLSGRHGTHHGRLRRDRAHRRLTFPPLGRMFRSRGHRGRRPGRSGLRRPHRPAGPGRTRTPNCSACSTPVWPLLAPLGLRPGRGDRAAVRRADGPRPWPVRGHSSSSVVVSPGPSIALDVRAPALGLDPTHL